MAQFSQQWKPLWCLSVPQKFVEFSHHFCFAWVYFLTVCRAAYVQSSFFIQRHLNCATSLKPYCCFLKLLYLSNLSSLEFLTLQSVHEPLWSSHVTDGCWSSWSSLPLTFLLIFLCLTGCHHFLYPQPQTLKIDIFLTQSIIAQLSFETQTDSKIAFMSA